MDNKEILRRAQLIESLHNVANKPDENNDIIIHNNKAKIIIDGIVFHEREIDVIKISNDIRTKEYGKNIFYYKTVLNPLEADRNNNKKYWSKNYNRINTPKFMSIMLLNFTLFGDILDLSDFCKMFLAVYCERANTKISRIGLYTPEGEKEDVFKYQGVQIPFEGKLFNNHLIKFKDEFEKLYVFGFPINEFFTADICSRLVKVYGSILRDMYNAVMFTAEGAENYYYSLYYDLQGVDGILNGYPILACTNTYAGNEFIHKKVAYRHPGLNLSAGFTMRTNIKSGNSVYLPNKELICKMIEQSQNKNLSGLISIEY